MAWIPSPKGKECVYMVIMLCLVFSLYSQACAQRYSIAYAPDRLKYDLARVMSGPDSNAIYLEMHADRYDIKDASAQYIHRLSREVIIKMKNYAIDESPGDPALPYQVFDLAVPPDADIGSLNIEIVEISQKQLKGTFNIAAAPPLLLDPDTASEEQLKWEIEKWGMGKNIVNGKNILIYEKDQFYPENYCRVVPGGQIRKWRTASIVFYPFRYNPVKRTLMFADEVLVRVSFKRNPALLRDRNMQQLLRDTKFDERVKGIFINYDQAKQWYNKAAKSAAAGGGLPPDASGNMLDPDYVIITTDAIFANSTRLADFCFHKQDQGFSVMVVTEHDNYTVTGSSTGYSFTHAPSGYADVTGEAPDGTAEKIRKWLQDNYLALGIEYVLLVGNPDPDNLEAGDAVGDIPMQVCWTSIISDYPNDMYFSDLTGDWNLDNDKYIGEWYPVAAAGGYSYSTLPAGINGNLFCARWEGVIEVSGVTGTSGYIYIYGYSEGNTKVWLDVDNNGYDAADLVVDDATEHHPEFVFHSFWTNNGTYPIKVEYTQSTGEAYCLLYANSGSAGVTASMKHADAGGTYSDFLTAEYYNDNNFSGPPDFSGFGNPYAEFILDGDRGTGGVDFGPEVIVGRIPFYSEDLNGDGSPDYDLLDNIFNKIISYENADVRNEAWRHRALISTPYMYVRAGIEIADYEGGEYLRNHIATLPFWEWYRIHPKDYGVGAEVTTGCSYNETVNGWNDAADPNDGRGIVMWRTHGSQTAASLVFGESLIPDLDDSKPSVLIQTTCQNGHPEAVTNAVGTTSYPLGYNLLKHGAIGSFCSTRNSLGGTFDETLIDISSKNNPYLMYFLAKGVIDNIPFGDVLFHAKYNDANIGSYWNQIFNYNLYGDPTLSLFGRSPKSNNDIVFLLDGSGSMLSEGKWDAAKDGAVLFYNLMKALRHPAFEDRYNAVVFRWPCGSSTDATTALPPAPGLKDISTPLTLANFAAYTPIGNYCTPIGRGLEVAIDQFELSTEESFYSNKTILLLSDGAHNQGIDPLSVAFPADAGIKVQAVGLGEDYIEPDRIRDIADATDGDYRISPSPRVMEDFFCQILCNTSWKLQDITVTGSAAPVDQNIAAFIVIWDDPAVAINFDLDPPGAGANITSTTLGTAYPGMTVTYHSPAAGETHAFYTCENIPDAQLGDWQFTNINSSGTPVAPADVLLKVIEDPRVIADFDIADARYQTGQPIRLTAQMTEDGKAMTGLTEVYAELITSPATSTGDLMSANSPTPAYLKAASVHDGSQWSNYLMGIMERLGMTTLNATGGPQVRLTDDGLNGDLKKDDGNYTGYFNNTEYVGSYTFKFRAKGKNKNGRVFDRNEILSEYVELGASPGTTEITMVSQSRDSVSGMITATIRLTPRDKFGHLLGPFQGDLIRLWSSTGEFEKDATGKLKYDDLKNGSYSFTLKYPEGKKPQVTASVGNNIVAEHKVVGITHIIPPVKKYSFSIHSGVAIPTGNFADYYDPGFNVLLDFEYRIRPMISAVLYAGYNDFKAKKAPADNTYWINISANVKYYRQLAPLLYSYAVAGPGLYIPETGSSEGGGNIGAGLDYEYSRNLTFEIGGDFHRIFDPKINFLHFHAGLIYKFR